jgi:hypothetical protein
VKNRDAGEPCVISNVVVSGTPAASSAATVGVSGSAAAAAGRPPTRNCAGRHAAARAASSRSRRAVGATLRRERPDLVERVERLRLDVRQDPVAVVDTGGVSESVRCMLAGAVTTAARARRDGKPGTLTASSATSSRLPLTSRQSPDSTDPRSVRTFSASMRRAERAGDPDPELVLAGADVGDDGAGVVVVRGRLDPRQRSGTRGSCRA